MKIEWKSCLKISVSIFLLFLCVTYWASFTSFLGTIIAAAAPLLIGCVLAYILNILMSFYERHYFPKAEKKALTKSRRPVCMIVSFITLVLIVFLLIRIVVPELIASGKLLAAHVPNVMSSLAAWFEENGIITEGLFESLKAIDWESMINRIISALTTGVGNVMEAVIKTVSSVLSGIVTAAFALIFSIYILADKEKLVGQFKRVMKRYMKENVFNKAQYILSVLNDCFRKYIVGQCTEAIILGALCTVGMLILRFPYAAMTGAVVAFTALIPVAGAYIGAAVGAFMIMTVSPIKAVLFLVFIVVLQQLEGNLIYPRVVGSSLGLPAIWVLAAVTVGGSMMGIAGMLIGVPLTAAVYRLLREHINGTSTKADVNQVQ